MAAKAPAPAKTPAAPAKSKKPKFKGINHPVDIPKAFRSSGNHILLSAALKRKNTKPSAMV